MNHDTDHALLRHEARHEPVSDCPVLAGNAVDLLESAQAAISAIFDAIENATNHLHLEYYIFDDVHVGGRSLVELLIAAIGRGVQVVVIYDGIGSLSTPNAVIDRLNIAGAQTLEFRPLNPLRAILPGTSTTATTAS